MILLKCSCDRYGEATAELTVSFLGITSDRGGGTRSSGFGVEFTLEQRVAKRVGRGVERRDDRDCCDGVQVAVEST